MMMFLLFMMILLFLNSVGYLYLNRRAGAGILRLRGYRNYSHFRMEELLEARYDSLVFLPGAAVPHRPGHRCRPRPVCLLRLFP